MKKFESNKDESVNLPKKASRPAPFDGPSKRRGGLKGNYKPGKDFNRRKH